jgi:hypothetical protein
MLKIRHAEDRGLANLSWLNSRHSFSFGQLHILAHLDHGFWF